MSDKRYRLGIDIGGTFTDLFVVDEVSGATLSFKTPSVPSDPAQAVRNGVRILEGAALRGIEGEGRQARLARLDDGSDRRENRPRRRDRRRDGGRG